MSSYFQKFKTSVTLNKRDIAIKENLLTQLMENAKEIQFECQQAGSFSAGMTESTNTLCNLLEAIFLHGLKESPLWQRLKFGDDHRRNMHADVNAFWTPLLMFLHREVIQEIQNASQLQTEIGYCRSWIRSSLNDGLLSSYLNNIRKNSTVLAPFYNKYAFILDSDMCEVIAKILEGLETCIKVNLPTNSSLLNQWTETTLQLAGVWLPQMKLCQIASGIDVAITIDNSIQGSPSIEETKPKPVKAGEFFAESISNSPFARSGGLTFHQTSDLSEQENLKILLQKVKDQLGEIDEAEMSGLQHIEVEESEHKAPAIGNSVSLIESWSSGGLKHQLDNLQSSSSSVSRSNSFGTNSISSTAAFDRQSYSTLLVRYDQTCRRQDWVTDIWTKFERCISTTDTITNNQEDNEDCASTADDLSGFELIPKNVDEQINLTDLKQMVRESCHLGKEIGLNQQGFTCAACPHPLSVGTVATSSTCGFSGRYYCENCISTDLFIIPAKVIYNWDFRRYSVSKRAARFLMEFKLQPFLDLKILNPDIYSVCDEMALLQALRIRLNFLRAYLFTCCDSVIDQLKKQCWTKGYVYEHIHTYSMADLQEVQGGSLAGWLQKAVQFAEEHVFGCRLCSQKGFICEICNSPRVLYPFQIDSTFRCKICGAVFHPDCLNESEPCPKCERQRKREDLPLHEALQRL